MLNNDTGAHGASGHTRKLSLPEVVFFRRRSDGTRARMHVTRTHSDRGLYLRIGHAIRDGLLRKAFPELLNFLYKRAILTQRLVLRAVSR